MKQCTKCKQEKNISCFRTDNSKPDKKHIWCNECKMSAQKLRMYGVTKERFNEMVAEQNGVCAICGNPPSSKKSLCIDHCHETGTVRGLLCNRCNVCIGAFEDSIEFLSSAIHYLSP